MPRKTSSLPIMKQMRIIRRHQQKNRAPMKMPRGIEPTPYILETRTMSRKPNIPQAVCGMLPPAMESYVQNAGLPRFRANQILEWVWEKYAGSYDDMTNLPKDLRHRLAEELPIVPLELVKTTRSGDDTQKILSRLADGNLVESVLISAPGRLTACVSSQVGCALGCRFCASGLNGLVRNLEASEITGQIQLLQSIYKDRISNIVYMGMGEPFANFDQVLESVSILNDEKCGGIGARKITISTSGLVPGILRLIKDRRQVRLSISLHAATDEVRDRIMPINQRYPIAEVLQACRKYQAETGRMITFEYILIDGITCTPDQAQALARILRGIRSTVNLIPYNTVEGLPYQRPPLAAQKSFLQTLMQSGIRATLRMEKGHEINAACGQLRLQTMNAGG
jgi:23S rRNA (adenine2503-C2)-methyltransferase